MSWWSRSGLSDLPKPMQVDRDQLGALVDQLVEAVLPVGAGLAPVHRAGVVVDRLPVERDVLAVGLHGQLLQVGGEPLQVLLVGHHAVRSAAPKKSRVPDGEQAHQHRQVLRQRRGAEVLVHLVEAGQHLVETVRADRHHRRQADRRVHRVPAADPVPEAEHVRGVDAELATRSALVETATKCLATAASSPSCADHPVPRGVRVGQRLQRAERLGGDDEQRLVGGPGPGSPRRSRSSRRWRRTGTSGRAGCSGAAPRRP